MNLHEGAKKDHVRRRSYGPRSSGGLRTSGRGQWRRAKEDRAVHGPQRSVARRCRGRRRRVGPQWTIAHERGRRRRRASPRRKVAHERGRHDGGGPGRGGRWRADAGNNVARTTDGGWWQRADEGAWPKAAAARGVGQWWRVEVGGGWRKRGEGHGTSKYISIFSVAQDFQWLMNKNCRN
jgi:hypothetical protein